MRWLRLYINDILIFGLLSILILVWFFNVIFYKNIFSYGDLAVYFYPLRHFAADSIKRGNTPLWNPYLGNGTPFLASLQPCIFYPVSIIYYLSKSFDNAFNWYIIIHFYLAGIFMYTLMRHWRFQRAASFISSLVFVFGGYLSSVINMNTSLSSVIWLPIVFLFFDMTLRKKSLSSAMLTSLFLSIQFLGGEPTIIYATVWLMFFYLSGFCAISYIRDKNIKDIPKIIGLFLIVAGLWIFITAVQLLPFMELLAKSTRARPEDFSVITRWSLSPRELLSLFIPYMFGDITFPLGHLSTQDWIASFYIGIMPIVLIALAISIRPDKKTIFFMTTAVISFILAAGRFTPLYAILHNYMFGFSYIRYPVKFLFISSFALSILSGIGYDAFCKIEHRKGIHRNLIRLLVLLNGLLGLLLVLSLKFWDRIYVYFIKFSFLKAITEHIRLENLFTIFLHNSAQACRLFIIFTLAALSLTLYLNKRLRLSTLSFLIVSIIFFDLAGVNMGISKVMGIDIFRKKPLSFYELEKDKSFFRIMRTSRVIELNRFCWGFDYAKGYYDRKKTFVCNTPMLDGIYDSQSYDSLHSADRAQFVDAIYGPESKLINLLNVKYLIDTEPVKEGSYEVIYSDTLADFPIVHNGKLYAHFYINKNNDYMERAFLVKDAIVFQNRNDILSFFKDKDFDPAKTVVLEEKPVIARTEIASSPYAKTISAPRNDNDVRDPRNDVVEIISYKPEEVIIEATLNEPKFLVLSDSYYPGWKVYVDGKPDKLYRAYYILRAVSLDKGMHIVKFVFDPLSYKIGKYITLTTLGLLALFGVLAIVSSKLKSQKSKLQVKSQNGYVLPT